MSGNANSGRKKGEPQKAITSRVSPAQYEKIKRRALGEGRTVSNYLLRLIQKDLASPTEDTP